MNSLKHGLCSEIVRVPEDFEAINTRARQWLGALKPQNNYHAWLMDEVAIITIKLDRCERMERRLRDEVSLRAEQYWDDDRRTGAHAIGQRLADRPADVVDELRRFPQGCDWLMDRWAMLARAAKINDGRWSADQRRLAFDLLGTPFEIRDGRPGEVIDLDGEVIEAPDPIEVARREVEALLIRREEVLDADTYARNMAEADMVDASTPELRRIRRYEGTLHNRLRWCLAQLEFESPRLRANSDLLLNYFAPTAPAEPEVPEPTTEPVETPAAVVEPAPAPESTIKPVRRKMAWEYPNPHPPFDLEPHEFPPPGQKPDIPAILSARLIKKMEKADARREARRRKVERLRA